MAEVQNGGMVDHPVLARAISPIPANRDVFNTVLESVTQSIAGSIKGTGLTGAPLLAAVSGVVAGAAREAVEKGGDLVPGTKAIIMGVVRGAGTGNPESHQILSHAAKVIIHHTADRNGNLAAAIKGIILGAIASARTMGGDTAKAASIAAQGALEGASEAGSVTVERVVGALKEPIGGSKVVLPEPLAT